MRLHSRFQVSVILIGLEDLFFKILNEFLSLPKVSVLLLRNDLKYRTQEHF